MYGERELIDLEPYRKGEKIMMNICDKCKQMKDMTKDLIMIEEQNNKRKRNPNYDPNCDELVFFGWTCEDCKREERASRH